MPFREGKSGARSLLRIAALSRVTAIRSSVGSMRSRRPASDSSGAFHSVIVTWVTWWWALLVRLWRGHLFRFNLTRDRRNVSVSDPRLRDRVADNLAKFDLTESESLL